MVPMVISLGRVQGLPWVWGVPADVPGVGWEAGHHGDRGDHGDRDGVRVAVRAVTCAADPEALHLWLCQLRRAPYSYDWIDNFGRRSPRVPDPALTELEIGQRVMTIFTLTALDPGRSVTLRMNGGWPTQLFGALDVRYDIVPDQGSPGSVLVARLRMPLPPGPLARLRRTALAWGDLLMMRKQLHTLARLAEATTASRSGVQGRLGAARRGGG